MNEATVADAIRELSGEPVVAVVAHRLSTVIEASVHVLTHRGEPAARWQVGEMHIGGWVSRKGISAIRNGTMSFARSPFGTVPA